MAVLTGWLHLSRNLRQLTRVAEPAPSSAMPTDMAEGLGRVDWPPELDFESAATLLSAYRTAWVRAGSLRIGGRQKAEEAWRAWLSEASVIGVDDDRLVIRVKTKFVRDQLFKDYGDVCRLAAEAVGYAGADFEAGPVGRAPGR
ncbi:MAG: hypothetical protein ACRC44_06645 [Bifidobacterium asteroides]